MSEAKSELKKLQVTIQWLQLEQSSSSTVGLLRCKAGWIKPSAAQLRHAAATSCSKSVGRTVSSWCVLSQNLTKVDPA